MTQNPQQPGQQPNRSSNPNLDRGPVPSGDPSTHIQTGHSQPASYPGAEAVTNPNGHYGSQGAQSGAIGGSGSTTQYGPPAGAQANTGAPPHHGEGTPLPTAPQSRRTTRQSSGSGPRPNTGSGPAPSQAPDNGPRRTAAQSQHSSPGSPGRARPNSGPTRIVSPDGEQVREKPAGGVSGYFAIVGAIVLLLLAVLLGIVGFVMTFAQVVVGVVLFIVAVLSFIASMFLFKGCTSVAPGHAVVLQLYGKYVGTVRQSGLRFVNPFYTKDQISTRIRNHETSTLKVNDLDGNPIEIGAVVVWQVRDTAQAMFEVDDFEEFVAIQAETAVRHIANSYAYDSSDSRRMSLRDNADEITSRLSDEVAARVMAAGVTVIESRITQLAYAPEIARAMLQRQQATAVVAARQLIVEGAVGMVETAIEEIEGRRIVTLGQTERSDLVSNLMIVLCGDQAAQPTISTTRNQQSAG
ncbi:regulator of protease activity HflC (stomatin/prohibitin superfamily) [Brevibacterium epidermidis]|jgi:regulator of protease activity HflC (stomatin/prohibitin superfamily)|uniref:Regulator of protease activity HflC (Stomatin/prohibitin superfamily) n=1 Tax=Brevibacterium epidermidis TaxID=1698 RepID=A0ABV4EKL0_BREEP